MRLLSLCCIAVVMAAPARLAYTQPGPLYDHHQHLLSPAVARLIHEPKSFTARDLIAQMDKAGLQRAVVLSMAYQFGNPNRPPVPNEYDRVREENNWTAAQVKAFPDRLTGVCGVDPLRDYAVREIERCSRDPYLRAGLKLHSGNSDIDLDNPEHVRKLRRVFAAADAHGMAIIIHLHANMNLLRPYGHREAEVFLNQVLPAAPHSTVQIAHLAGGGGFDDPGTDAALGVFLEAIGRRDPRVAHLYFDISGVAGLGEWRARRDLIASRIRAAGVQRILFGCDGAWSGFTPDQAIAAFRELPLTSQEFHTIATNEAPYLLHAR